MFKLLRAALAVHIPKISENAVAVEMGSIPRLWMFGDPIAIWL